MMNTTLCAVDRATLPFTVKQIEPELVASVRFRGVLNVTSYLWMVRDWAKRAGCQLTGPPSCVFGLDTADPSGTLCEIQWAVAGSACSSGGEITFKQLAPRHVLTVCHRAGSQSLHETVQALRRWGHAKGYRTTGERREIYHSALKLPAKDRVTEIQLFVEDPA